MDKYLLGYILSIVFAIPVTYFWSLLLHKAIRNRRTQNDLEAERIQWIPLPIGIFKRAIITTLVCWEVSGTAGFIGAWIVVKAIVRH